MEAIWHVYSDGTRADIPFDTDEDKVYAWNSIAVSARIAGVRVLVATVNDTHLHSLVCGEEESAERFRQLLQQRMFHTREQLPDEWRYDADGRILPESFIDYAYVEELFKSVRAFIAFQYVRKEDEARMKQEIHRRYLEHRTIQDLRRIGNRHSKNLCGHALKNAPFQVRLKVAVRLLHDGHAGKSPTLAKALFLRPDDLRFLV